MKILVALGGNAILEREPSAHSQQEVVKKTVTKLVKLIQEGHQLVITHGNGPQVGNLLLQQEAANSPSNPAMPLDSAVAMTQGSIGYWLQQSFDNQFQSLGMEQQASTILTQVVVDPNDSAFQNPTKPIGPFFTRESAKILEEKGKYFIEDAGRGYRQVVPSPKPIDIVEKKMINQLVEAGHTVIACGGGGIPVVKNTEQRYEGVEAVIDKDFASGKLAEILEVDLFVILTAVDHVFINYNQPNQKRLTKCHVEELKQYISENQFAKGSMLPKIEAAITYAELGRKSIITSIENISNLFNDRTCGTLIEL